MSGELEMKKEMAMGTGMRSIVAILSLALLCSCGKDEVGKNSVTENNSNNGTVNNTSNNTTVNNTSNNTTVNNTSNNTTANNTSNNTVNNTTGTNNQTTSSRPLDLLLVLDNSGSSCVLQSDLRANIRSALAELTATDLDVQIGITTTDTEADYPLEPIAEPGELQSTPQPVPGFDPTCQRDSAGGYGPIREAVDLAVRCAGADPAEYDWTDADIECALYNQPNGCTIDGVCRECTPEALFPPADSYPAFEKVLAVREYVDEAGKIDFESLVSTFECMSFVGTRGYGIEKGLEAAVMAVSPELTGGAVDSANADSAAPNHGLIRTDADFGLLFLTNENDCSHDGTLAEDTACGGDVCEFANIEGEDSPLIEPSVFADQLVANLQSTKADPSFDQSRVFVASIHGKWDRYQGPAPSENECSSIAYEGIAPICTPEDGDGRVAFSGDRYERFLDAFDDANTYPARGSDGDHRLGAVCEADLGGVFIDAMSVLAR